MPRQNAAAMHLMPHVVSLCSSWNWHCGVLGLARLLELGHVERDDNAVPYHLVRIIQERFQGIIDTLLISETAKRFGSLMSNHARLLRIAKALCQAWYRCRVAELPEDERNLMAEQGRWIFEASGKRMDCRYGGGQIRW